MHQLTSLASDGVLTSDSAEEAVNISVKRSWQHVPIVGTYTMAGETGGTRGDLPLRDPLIPFPGWDQGGPNIGITKMGTFYFSLTVFQQLQYLYVWFWVL